MIENYFEDNLKGSIYLQGQEVMLEFPKNTFICVLYLHEKIYGWMEDVDICIIYGQIMIHWNQFDLLYDIFQHPSLPTSFQTQAYFEKLINLCLEDLYADTQLILTEETKQHISNILKLGE
jgi:hypothetical protein